MKICSKCREEKSESEFGANSSMKDGFQTWCKKCVKKQSAKYYRENRSKVKAVNEKWRKENPEKMKLAIERRREKDPYTSRLANTRSSAKKHGHAPCSATTEELRETFSGECHVCGASGRRDGKPLSLDHDHKTGCFRGWLCSNCNTALGLAGDSVGRLLELALYLEKHKGTI